MAVLHKFTKHVAELTVVLDSIITLRFVAIVMHHIAVVVGILAT